MPLDFSLFYFANDEDRESDKYRLLLEGARFADAHGFKAVWTPERHFHSFGGLYPNPAVTGAAIAAITKRVHIRAGSVVLPLQDPIRVAEEWAIVDNLSGGRAGVSFASGWHAHDFVFAPTAYADRHAVMLRDIETVRALWRGETRPFKDGAKKRVAIGTRPRPVQAELPIWLTAAHSADTFEAAGRIGAGVLTHLLKQTRKDLAAKIAAYRRAWTKHGHAGRGSVVLMLHTFVHEDREVVRAEVEAPMLRYLQQALEFAATSELPKEGLREREGNESVPAIVQNAFDRYFSGSALFGTPEDCAARAERFLSIGVDEIACLIDFGVPTERVLAALPTLSEVKDRLS